MVIIKGRGILDGNVRICQSWLTKKSILTAAQKLFAELGYEKVTMREIAKEAGCSHTTIYIYYKDKIALLHQLSMPSLLELKQQFEAALLINESPELRLKQLSHTFIRFCLSSRNMYDILFIVKSSRMDQDEPELEINRQRIELFGLLRSGLKGCFEIKRTDEQLLMYSRIYFFMLQGIVATYIHSEETADALMERLTVTFDRAFEVLLKGLDRH